MCRVDRMRPFSLHYTVALDKVCTSIHSRLECPILSVEWHVASNKGLYFNELPHCFAAPSLTDYKRGSRSNKLIIIQQTPHYDVIACTAAIKTRMSPLSLVLLLQWPSFAYSDSQFLTLCQTRYA